MHIHVLGVGSIGSLVALHLRHSTPHQITLLVKRQSFAQTFKRELEQTIAIEREGSVVRADGFTVELTDPAAETMRNLLRRPDGTLRASILRPRKRYAGVQPSNDPQTPISSLIVTTKAPSTSRAIRALSSRLSPKSTITLLQNGMGVYEELCANIFPSPESRPHFVLASTTHGVWSKRPFYTVHAGFGDLVFGVAPSSRVQLPITFEKSGRKAITNWDLGLEEEQQDLLEKLAPYESLHGTLSALLSLRGLQPSWIGASDLQERLQRKLVTNSVVNPLTALMGCRNGSLVGNQYAHRIGRGVCQEAEKVFRAQMLEDESGRPIRDSNFMDQDLANVQLPLKLTAPSFEAEFVRVARLTSVNFSSMLQDVNNGRETEVNYMNGYLSRMGRKYGIPTPVNDMLRTLIQMKGTMPSGEES
ncbi:ketopantoate reductase PanE/ApbA C terminal-domain-containing protein [Rhizoctonia solani]|nr:ketopantoate reductase PanE/ApbA C terminal-domain-containing protein [Rhizoctonia solani]